MDIFQKSEKKSDYKILEFREKQVMTTMLHRILHKLRFGKLLSAEINPQPLFFILIVMLNKFDLIDLNLFAASLLAVGLVFFLTAGYNYFFYCGPVVGSGLIGVSWAGGLIGIFWANKTWKMYLYLFLLAQNFISFDKNFQNIYELAISAFILIKIFEAMIFQSVRDNKLFFIGFFTIGALSLFQFVVRNSSEGNQMRIQNKIILIPFLAGLSYTIIDTRSEQLRSMKVVQDNNILKNPGVLSHHIELVTENISTPSGMVSYLNEHSKMCELTACYCRKYEQLHQKQLEANPQKWNNLRKEIVDSIYQQFLMQQNSCQQSDRIQSLHNYLFFLIQANQFHRVVQIMFELEEQNHDYFEILASLKVREKIYEQLEKSQYFDDKANHYQHIYSYDYNMGYINKEIRQILLEKISFWKEVCQESPKVKKMEKIGRKLVDRIQDLHSFYMTKMRPSEEALSNFNCSIIYATYLLTTSNYLDFANSLLKKNQACIQQAKSQGNVNSSILLLI